MLTSIFLSDLMLTTVVVAMVVLPIWARLRQETLH